MEKNAGRVRYAIKNIIFGWGGNVVTMLLRFALRGIFLMKLEETLFGVEDLYTSVLTMLSFAELGVGTAVNFSLYGPVARGEKEKIKSYMLLYRRAYRVIAIVIAVLGIALLPFLPRIVHTQEISAAQLRLYYLIFLFNTVSSYFVAWKYSLANAEQKNYIQTNTITITKMITVVLQMAALLTLPNYLLYLLIQAGVELGQKIFISRYLDRRYPLLKEKKVEPLTSGERELMVRNTKALVLHRVGDMARLQTDEIIISSFLDVVMVGLIGNYKLIVSSVSNYVNVIFNSVISGFGNLIATENREKQLSLFCVYRFFAVWIYGFTAVGFFLLLSPLLELAGQIVGKDLVLPSAVIAWYLTDYYFKGERIVLSNFKTAAGVFEQDKYLTLLQGAVNLVLSIVLVQRIGMTGIFVGTVVSGLIANITKPIIIYRVCFRRSAFPYFRDSLKYLAVMGVTLGILIPAQAVIMPRVTVWSFLLMMGIITGVFNGIFLAAFGRTAEFRYLYRLVKDRLG